jgi:hypothetical protein
MISVAYQYIHVKQTCVTLTYLIYQYLPFVTEKTHVEGHNVECKWMSLTLQVQSD